ncbi:unnamed protein product [Pleuronectes platessa]|uniref:Uncharacterized protein n=1 Tax=Pleuronectes platessa TaxID=8262 RepID=A0A9N7U6N1_PLEPL|nr:unnamed protein product [Pleuronectes platessa]
MGLTAAAMAELQKLHKMKMMMSLQNGNESDNDDMHSNTGGSECSWDKERLTSPPAGAHSGGGAGGGGGGGAPVGMMEVEEEEEEEEERWQVEGGGRPSERSISNNSNSSNSYWLTGWTCPS